MIDYTNKFLDADFFMLRKKLKSTHQRVEEGKGVGE